MMKDLRQGVQSFKKGMKELLEEDTEEAESEQEKRRRRKERQTRRQRQVIKAQNTTSC